MAEDQLAKTGQNDSVSRNPLLRIVAVFVVLAVVIGVVAIVLLVRGLLALGDPADPDASSAAAAIEMVLTR